MVKVEDIQNYGKEQFEQVVANATTFQSGIQAIATAYGDYAKKSFEDTKSFAEKLSGVKSLDKALEAQSEYAKSAYETFVAESQKIAEIIPWHSPFRVKLDRFAICCFGLIVAASLFTQHHA